MDPIQPIAPDRAVPRIEPTYLTPLEREREKQRRERERERRRRTEDRSQPAGEGSENGAVEPNSGIDVRA